MRWNVGSCLALVCLGNCWLRIATIAYSDAGFRCVGMLGYLMFESHCVGMRIANFVNLFVSLMQGCFCFFCGAFDDFCLL